MAGQYIRYTPLGGTGGGGVTTINGASGPAINIVGGTGINVGTVGNTITITNTGTAPTGPPNTIAAFDGAGALTGLSEWVVNSVTGEIDGSFSGVSVSAVLPLRINSSNTITGNLQGLGVDLSGSSTTQDTVGIRVLLGDASATTVMNGIQVDMNSATCSGGDINGITINPGTAVSNNPQGVTGLQSGARIQVNGNTNLVSAEGFQIGSRLEHAFTVPIGSPVTGTDGLAVNVAGDFIVQDNIALGPFGLGLSAVGFISSMGIAATKTVDTINVFLPVSSFPDPGFTTGGSVTEFSMIRTFAPIPQGGTVSITNLYGLKLDNFGGAFSAAATNAWGIWIEDTALQNHFGGPVDMGALELNGSTSGVLRVEADPVTIDYTLVMPPAQGAAGETLQNDGAGNLSWASSGGGGANTALSNLASTAINTSLLPDSTVSYDIGSASLRFRNTYTQNLIDSSNLNAFAINNRELRDAGGNPAINFTGPDIDMTTHKLINVVDPTSAQDAATKNYVDNHVVPVNKGGTGQTTANAGFNALSPMTTGGDLIYGGASGVATRLANGTAGQVLQSNGTTTAPTWVTPAAAGANTALSNLTSTSINQNLVPDSDATRNMGTSAARWGTITANVFQTSDGSSGMQIYPSGATSPSGAAAPLMFGYAVSGAATNTAVITSTNAAANATATADVLIESGNKTAGTGNSGMVNIQTGTSAGGSRGAIRLRNGTEGTSGYLWTSTDANGSGSWQAPAGAASFVIVNETQSANTAGGTFTAGAWQTRVLNTTINTQTFASLSSNQVTLSSGTYLFEGSAPALAVNNHQTKIRDITHTTDVLIGTSEYSASTDLVSNKSFISGTVVVSGSTVFELQHQCASTRSSNGFGNGANFGVNEIYSTLKITKIA